MLIDSIEDIEFNPHKWINHIDKLKKIALGKDVFPVTCELDLVAYCNHNCNWCVDPIHKRNSLDLNFIYKLLEELQMLGVQGIVLKGGGEPTLNPNFKEVIKKSKENSFEVGVVTNGSKLKSLCLDIVQYTDYVRISIDGPTPSSHHNIHGTHDFSTILDGVAMILQERHIQQRRHPIVGLSFAMTYAMKKLVKEAIKLGDSMKVDYILLRPPFFEEIGLKSLMSIHDKKLLFDVFEDEKNKYTGKMKIFIDYWVSDTESKGFNFIPSSPRRAGCKLFGVNGIEHLFKCSATPLFGVITADKLVYPCCNLRFLSDWSIGKLDYEQGDTFKKIWHGNNRIKVVKKIQDGECLKFCTHPLSKYNEIIKYLRTSLYHKGFI